MTDLGRIWAKFANRCWANYKGKTAERVNGGVLYERMFYTIQQWHELIDRRYAEGASIINKSINNGKDKG
jgi:hypothetical protein